jgi:hypothetical protein
MNSFQCVSRKPVRCLHRQQICFTLHSFPVLLFSITRYRPPFSSFRFAAFAPHTALRTAHKTLRLTTFSQLNQCCQMSTCTSCSSLRTVSACEYFGLIPYPPTAVSLPCHKFEMGHFSIKFYAITDYHPCLLTQQNSTRYYQNAANYVHNKITLSLSH